MQAAFPRAHSELPVAAPARQPALAGYANDVEQVLAGARQDYLDAVPIAAALISDGGDGIVRIELANDRFRFCVEGSNIAGVAIASLPFFERSGLGPAIIDFLAGGEQAQEFDGDDGRGVGGRHFTVRIARLKPTPSADRRCMVSLIDKTQQVETERNLRAEMLRDSLSGLPNRIAFNERVAAILDDPDFREASHAVLVVDMTRFSRINECMGALAGDELLITFARRLVSALRPGDVLARTGGDEFGILLRLDKGIGDALGFANRIKAVMTAPFRLSELEIRVDCHIGCAILTRGLERAEEALRNAQFALKRSKRSGIIRVYEPHQAKAARRRFAIETELRRAIEGEQLTLAFQPLIDLPTGDVSGFEALARWEHPDEGAISPEEFIPVAEESGLIVPLGRWALRAATATLAEWDQRAGRTLPLHVSVNLSPIQIARDDVPAVVDHALREAGLPGRRLTLELTESAIVQDPERALEVLQALKALGTRVAMDDFGTGYTSLSYLQRLPIDVLKIDRSFVTGMLGDRDSGAIIRAVLSLADALGLATTAEGIESEELARTLAELGCSYGQGFFFAKPLGSAEALTYWLASNA